MKITLETVLQSIPSLQELSNAQNLSFKASYSLMKIIKSCIEANQAFEAARVKKALELSDKNEEGEPIIIEVTDQLGNIQQSYQLSSESQLALQEAVLEMRNDEIEISGGQIYTSELEKVTNIRPAALLSLDWLITDFKKPEIIH